MKQGPHGKTLSTGICEVEDMAIDGTMALIRGVETLYWYATVTEAMHPT